MFSQSSVGCVPTDRKPEFSGQNVMYNEKICRKRKNSLVEARISLKNIYIFLHLRAFYFLLVFMLY